jgi:predicted ATPase
LIEVLQRTLLLTRQDTDNEKVEKLERALTLYGMQDSLPLFTFLLSLPTPPQYPPLNLTPQKQKERTLQALVQLSVAQAERQATVSVWEDLHWADPSSLEFLTLLIEQIPTTKLLLILTFRPEFTPLWKLRSHVTQLMLNRLGKTQVEAMIEKVVEGRSLSAEVVEQIRAKTDGVPLFVEELTKSVVETIREQVTGDRGQNGKTVGALGIPATLQDALMARLDRLSTARQIAQLGATLGRDFSYELLHAVAPIGEADLQTSLKKLVEAEILYQRGVGEQARYFFKHALIQDTAYQSLLKSTRQAYHQQIAQVLEKRFPEAKETQPELLARHYTEAGLITQAIPYWQQAGQRAIERLANIEAISHLTKGLEGLQTLPDTPERIQHELLLLIALGIPLQATKGIGALEVETTYTRALDLCRRIGETPLYFSVMVGLATVHLLRAEYHETRALAEQLLQRAREVDVPFFLVGAHGLLGIALYFLGELVPARAHLEQGIALYDPQWFRFQSALMTQEPGVPCLGYLANTLWLLGYPDQALQRNQEALTLAHDLARPFSEALALWFDARLYAYRREAHLARERAETLIALSTEQGFAQWIGAGIQLRGQALIEQEEFAEGLAQLRRGWAAIEQTGQIMGLTWSGMSLAEGYVKTGQVGEGEQVLAEALEFVEKTGERAYEAELYRLKGTLMLQSQASLGQVSDKSQASQDKAEVADPRPLTPDPQGEAEACFLKAIEVAQKQQAKSWELRAATSLARLWQQHGKQKEAHELLAEIYGWFTEGVDTKDLQEAKMLLEKLT